MDLKQFDISIICLEKAIEIDGNCFKAYVNLGVVYSKLKLEDAAIACYDQALTLDPKSPISYLNRGESFKEKGNLTEALINFDKAFNINPQVNGLIGKRYETAMYICEWKDFYRDVDLATLKIRENVFACTPFSSLILFDNPELHLLSSQTYVATQVPLDKKLGPLSKREPKGRVRIGYYSADLYYHPVSIWLAEQLENHDKSKVELYAFCLKSVQDPMRDRLESAFDHWIDVQSMSDLEITKLSRELGIDIAIDLNGHTADGRPGIFAARAAPIQLNHLGFPGSMGAEYIDYMIFPTPSSDEDLEEVERNRQFITEKIAYVPSSFTYDRQRQLSDEPLTRAQFGLPEAGFVFTCQNGCQKLMPEVFDIWMEILKAVPGSVLWLLKPNETAVKNLIKEANARGVDAERLIFTAREVVPIDQERARIGKYLASYKLADLFLDTWPYNAGTTAIDALWAGLPVLTKEGKAPVARMAAGALRGIEVPELITRTPQAYQELAIELAHSPEKLRQLKEKVQGHRLKTALFDPVGNTRHIENAYLEMYRRYQEGLEPEDFSVEEKTKNFVIN
jgi:predicted O-linked N-acetylglucosamine transferase (SPINDLY family)